MSIESSKEFYDHVLAEYWRDTVELNSLHFDVYVKMKEKDIIETYAEIQCAINGDEVVRIENGIIQDDLIPEGEYETLYEGNCRKYLESFNTNPRFARFCDEEKLDFIL